MLITTCAPKPQKALIKVLWTKKTVFCYILQSSIFGDVCEEWKLWKFFGEIEKVLFFAELTDVRKHW